MNAVARVVSALEEIECTGAERVAFAALHAAGPFCIARGLAGNHGLRRRPVRPRLLELDAGRPAKLQSGPANAHAVTNSLAAVLHEEEEALVGIDDDGPDGLGCLVIDLLAQKSGIHLGYIDRLDPEFL